MKYLAVLWFVSHKLDWIHSYINNHLEQYMSLDFCLDNSNVVHIGHILDLTIQSYKYIVQA